MDEAEIGRRDAERFDLECPADLVFADCSVQISLRNLSATGACICSPVKLELGMKAGLQWEHHRLTATVMWVDGAQAGLSFKTPLGEHVIKTIRTRAVPRHWNDAEQGVRLTAEKIMQNVNAV